MNRTPKPLSPLTCGLLILVPVAALLSVPYFSERAAERQAQQEQAARVAHLYQEAFAAADVGDLGRAEAALTSAVFEAPDHPSRSAAEARIQTVRIEQLVLRAADADRTATQRRDALLELVGLDPANQDAYRERAAALETAVQEEARQAEAQARIDAILAAADAEPEGGRYAPQREVLPEGFECGRKRSCSQMKNCAEARAYFDKCEVAKLDPDGDGIPCEELCTWPDLEGP